MKFVNRQTEMQYLTSYLKSEPNALLFVYGPKSSGKSVLLGKVTGELDEKKFVIHFMDLRRILVYDFKSFLDTFFIKDIKGKIKDVLQGITVNIPFVSISVNDEPLLQKNPFKLIERHLETVRSKGLQPIIILDEIQLLNPWEIQQLLAERQQYKTIEDVCLFFVMDEYAKIREFRNALKEEGLCEEFDRITREIVQHGAYRRNDQEDAQIVNALVKKMAAYDFWFYKTGEQKIIANSQSIYWACEKMVHAKTHD